MHSFVIIVVSSSLLFYWSGRTLLLLRGTEESICEALSVDARRGRRIYQVIRAALLPAQQYV